MGYTGFVIAMAANIEFAACALPSRILHRTAEFLIVSRWGDDGEFLSVSRTGAASGSADDAPIGLSPVSTWVGLLLSEEAGETESRFLLLRRLPEGLLVAGSFIPAEGYLRLTRDIATLHLKAEGRHADCLDRQISAQDDAADEPRPSAAIAWHIAAVRRPWSGEFVKPPAP
jgi:hypothetical protein